MSTVVPPGGQPVTLWPKRYIFICLGCERLAESNRRDTLTCSPACRVRAHRSGTAKKQKAMAASWEITAASLGHAAALNVLRPDLSGHIMRRELTLTDAMPMVVAAFDERVRQILRLQR